MGLTNFPYGLTSFGQTLLGGGNAPTVGPQYFVDYGSGNDENSGTSPSDAWKTIEYANANALVVTNKFTKINLIGSATHVLAAMLTVSKSRVIFDGIDGSFGRSYGQAAKIQIGVTTAATDVAAILNTGVRNVFHNIKVLGENTVAQALYGMIDGGEYTQMINCHIEETQNLAVTGAADFVCNADSPQYINCTFGSLANSRVGSIVRPAVLFTKGLAASGKVTRDAEFINCNLWINASATTNNFAYGANATDIERLCAFYGCKFINNGISAFVPAQNVAFGATLTVGMVLLDNCVSLNAATAMSTTIGVFVNGSVPAAATTGIAVQAS